MARKIDLTLGKKAREFEVVEKRNSKESNSKFNGLDRINWGQSPGARQTMVGEYFTKMRLYRLDHPISAQYLTLLRNNLGLTIKQIIEEFPSSYLHTVGHWFRKDFGGSIPIPMDVRKLKEIFAIKNGLLDALERTALKFQTVKASSKGRNPGDFIEQKKIPDLKKYFKSLYLPPNSYIKLISDY